MTLAFSKMHGLGNDFVIVDARTQPLALARQTIARMGDRHRGVGFDQLLSIESASEPGCAFAYRIWNRDGSESGQCGNGVRCIAAWLARAGALTPGMVRLQGPAGPVEVEILAGRRVRVDMGAPEFTPAAIPFRTDVASDRYMLTLANATLEIGAVSMGNPHAVIEVGSLETAAVADVGAELEHSAYFPAGCNVEFVQIESRSRILMRVWERGAGEPQACGSGACAAMAVLRQRQQVDAEVEVVLPGGSLEISWQGAGHTLSMTGPAAFVFEGVWHD